MYRQHVLLKKRKAVLKFTLLKYHARCLASLQHVKLQIFLQFLSLYGKLCIFIRQLLSSTLISRSTVLLNQYFHSCTVESGKFEVLGTRDFISKYLKFKLGS